MKLNFSFLKKGKTIYWIVGGVVLFVVFYLIASKGSSSGSGSVTTIQSGPSDAQVAAATNLAMANISAGVAANQANAELQALGIQSDRDVALGTLQYQGNLAETEAGKVVALTGINAQKEIQALQGAYDVETARVASETQIATNQIQADMFTSQLEANRDMFAQQTEALTRQSLISQISTLKKKNRDEALMQLANTIH